MKDDEDLAGWRLYLKVGIRITGVFAILLLWGWFWRALLG